MAQQKKEIITQTDTERVVLVGLITPNISDDDATEYLKELAFLIETAGGNVVKTFQQRADKPNTATFVGSGKLNEIQAFVAENDIHTIAFDDDLTPSQQKNIAETLKCKVLDRTDVILDIFAKRAQTSYAKAQVELAQYQYLLPRLKRMWTHLERQQGGIGSRGPGESEIETDRRIVRDKITRLKEQLSKIDKQMSQQRKNRGSVVRVALVGYTNVGKSTLMNTLSGSDVFAENKLFATLDTTVRKVVLYSLPFLLADTVGFIRKLPHHLVESFKSTLDEVREADILLHIVDISHPRFAEQIEVVNSTLKDLNAGDKPMILVFNKIDNYSYIQKDEDDLTPKTEQNWDLDEVIAHWKARTDLQTCFISAKNNIALDELKQTLYSAVRKVHMRRYPYAVFPQLTQDQE